MKWLTHLQDRLLPKFLASKPLESTNDFENRTFKRRGISREHAGVQHQADTVDLFLIGEDPLRNPSGWLTSTG